MSRIKCTQNIKGKVKDTLKIIFGKSVVIGKTYKGLTVLSGFNDDSELIPVLKENNILLLSTLDRRCYIFLNGDYAAFANRIYADTKLTQIRLNELVTPFEALQKRYYKIPPQLLELIAKSIS